MNDWTWNPKTKCSGIITCIPQEGPCPIGCADCFFQSGRSYLEPLEKNLPHIPPPDLAKGRVVRMNDGNDSNFQRDLVEKTAQQYDDYFFNTSMPIELDTFSGPVVLTINPNKMTDDDFYKLEKIPHNLMFVRIRVNMWNQDTVVDPAVLYYTKKGCPVVLTYMAYYQETIPEEYKHWYQWEKRTTNSYWVLTKKGQEAIESDYEDELLVYTCGRRGHHACFLCGNCLREYYNAKERMRALKEK